MSHETAEQVLDLATRLNPQGPAGIVFFGGEPLLHRGLVRHIVRRARQRQAAGQGSFRFKLTTNGLALDSEFLDFSLRNQVLIAMSFDGVRAAHDAHRRLADGGPSFTRLLPRLRQLLQRRPYASILAVVNPDTVQHFAASMAFLLDQGARYLVVSLNYAGAWEESSLETLRQQYERLGDLYIQWTRAGRKFYLSPFEVKLASHIQGADFRKCQCELGSRQLSVDPQGWLSPCVQFARAGPAYRVGHVATGIDHEALRRLHDASEAAKEPCDRCALAPRCHNSCGCLNWQTTGDLHQVSPVLCHHEQLLIPIADRVGETLHAEGNELFLRKHYDPAYPLHSLLEDLA